jgi:hypothetical protein
MPWLATGVTRNRCKLLRLDTDGLPEKFARTRKAADGDNAANVRWTLEPLERGSRRPTGIVLRPRPVPDRLDAELRASVNFAPA